MITEFRISYSGRKLFLTCPKQYWYRYIIKDPTRGDPRTSMFGSIIGKIFEWFYERRYWADKDPVASCVSSIPEAIELVYLNESYLKGTNPGWEKELQDNLEKYVPSGVQIIRSERFLTPHSKAEVDLTVTYQKNDDSIPIKLVGRADFIHATDLKSVYILDGKASKYREKYVDSDQLIWYALSYYLKFQVSPVRLGFVFWSFPDRPVTWIAYDSDAMRKVLNDTTIVAQRVMDKDFSPTPSGECHRCNYRDKCEEGQKYLSQRRLATGGRISDSIFDLEST
jgi:hypothetical protein